MNLSRARAGINRIDLRITRWMADHGITLLRISIGVVFLWFGALKLVPGLSPAEGLIEGTVTFVPLRLFLPLLAVWEIAIGLGFITGKYLRATILLLFLQMPGTIAPVFLLPGQVFTVFPFGLTLEGQYIIKNLVLISAGVVIGSTVRGGRLIDDPAVMRGDPVERPSDGRDFRRDSTDGRAPICGSDSETADRNAAHGISVPT